jgi:hypothetical protein
MVKSKRRTRAKVLTWFEEAKLTDECNVDPPTRCESCDPDGSCESCNTVYGRFMDAVNEYASTCDDCMEMCSHDQMTMDPKTQLGYCPICAPKQPKEVRDRYGQSYEDYLPFDPDS